MCIYNAFTMMMQLTQNRTLFACNFLNNDLIFNPLALLELSQSPLSFNAIMLKQSMQMKEYVYLQCIYNVDAVNAHLNKNMKSNSNFLNKEII